MRELRTNNLMINAEELSGYVTVKMRRLIKIHGTIIKIETISMG